MPRPKRADKAGAIYHALNRGNARSTIFHKDGDYEAFERILAEGLQRYAVELLAYQLMPNHWHMVLKPTRDGQMSQLLCWVTGTHTLRTQSVFVLERTSNVRRRSTVSAPRTNSHRLRNRWLNLLIA